jgi:hypothetical protein
MIKNAIPVVLAGIVLAAAASATAKLPPPVLTDAQKQAAEEKKEKDKAAADKAKADLAAAEDAAVKNYHMNMKQQGKPIPKAVPVVAAPTPPTGGKPGPENNTAKAAQKSEQSKANTPNGASGGAAK